MNKDPSQWLDVTKIMDKATVFLGKNISYWFEHSPQRALNYLSYYKFASKMIGKRKRVLDVGCREGLGTWMLAVECGFAKGVDIDKKAVSIAENNWIDERITFESKDLFSMVPDQWDSITTFDVIEHIASEKADKFLQLIADNLSNTGIAIVGTTSLEEQKCGSEIVKPRPISAYTFKRLEEQMYAVFEHVFMFCANDEVVHTGYPRMADYFIAVGCKKRK